MLAARTGVFEVRSGGRMVRRFVGRDEGVNCCGVVVVGRDRVRWRDRKGSR